jgi:hypothetical protein
LTIREFTLNVTAPASSQDDDWAYRSTRPGVVWAHDFRNDAEMTNFMMTADPNAQTSWLAPIFNLPYLSSEPTFGSSRALRMTCWSSRLAAPLSASAAGTVEQIQLIDASAFADPAIASPFEYQVMINGGSSSVNIEQIAVVGKSGNTLTVRRGVDGETFAWAAGTAVGGAPPYRWSRPMEAFLGADNGIGVDDPGIAYRQSLGRTIHRWVAGPNRHFRWRSGYWGHQSYLDSYDAVWPVSPYTNPGQPTQNHVFEGTEYWLQWRMRLTANRWNDLGFQQYYGKVFYLQTCQDSDSQQIYLSTNSPSSTPYRVRLEHDFGQKLFTLAAQNYPAGEWATYMLHVKPGRNGIAESTVELFYAPLSATAWTTLLSTTTYALSYDMEIEDASGDPPAYNSFAPVNYPNPYKGSGGLGAPLNPHSVDYTQVILSRQEIPLPLPISP